MAKRQNSSGSNSFKKANRRSTKSDTTELPSRGRKKPSTRSQQFSKPTEQIREVYEAKHIAKKRLNEHCPIVLENKASEHHALLDSGNGLKLERFGKIRIIRPEAQAIWQPKLPKSDWENVDAVFTGDTNEEGAGRWAFPQKQLPETWDLSWDGLNYLGRFTSFRHVGVFPEQAVHWSFMENAIKKSASEGKEFKVLNLFGYTGLASLVAARAGAHVTHVDASKKAIGWARENQDEADLLEKPIRWICEDAMRFCEREVRRGNTYDGILLDPPHYGRGPKGEVWQLFEDLPKMLDHVRDMTNQNSSFVILTAYAIRASFYSMHEIMQEKFGDYSGSLESGELVLKTESSDRRLSTSMFSRWVAK